MPFIRDCISTANPLIQREILAIVRIKANHLQANQFYMIETEEPTYGDTEMDVAEAEKGYVPSVGDTISLEKDKNGYLKITLVKVKDKIIELNVKKERANVKAKKTDKAKSTTALS